MKKIIVLLLLIVSTATAKDIKYNYNGLIFISSTSDTVGTETRTNITISGKTMKIRVPEFKKTKEMNLDFKLDLNELDADGVRRLHVRNEKYYGVAYLSEKQAILIFESDNETKFTFIYFKR